MATHGIAVGESQKFISIFYRLTTMPTVAYRKWTRTHTRTHARVPLSHWAIDHFWRMAAASAVAAAATEPAAFEMAYFIGMQNEWLTWCNRWPPHPKKWPTALHAGCRMPHIYSHDGSNGAMEHTCGTCECAFGHLHLHIVHIKFSSYIRTDPLNYVPTKPI